MLDLTAARHFAEKTARAAGALLRTKCGHSTIAVDKGTRDFATDADLASERLIIDAIKNEYPDHAILAEESGSAVGNASEYVWVIDPLDGTKNFQAGIPFWCVSIALRRGDASVVGVVYAPLTDELYSAHAGGGATMNREPLRVSETSTLAHTIAIVDIPRLHPEHTDDSATVIRIRETVWRMRTFGAAAYELALVARGAIDAYIDLSRNTKLWDVAAGELIVREAGGRVTDMTPMNAPSPIAAVLATNAKLHDDVHALIA